jgi:hypothetical protein
MMFTKEKTTVITPQPSKDTTPKRMLKSGGHLIDNMLKKKYVSNDKQKSLFDTLKEDSQREIIESQANIELINSKGDGIRFEGGEHKLMNAFRTLLFKKSETQDKNSNDYYGGNLGVKEIELTGSNGIKEMQKSPQLSFTLYELTKEYNGGKNIGGANLKIVEDMLLNLANNPDKKALIRYTKVVSLGKGTREWEYESYDSLIKIVTLGYKDKDKDGVKINEHKEIIIQLHPIFIEQIKDKYVMLPIELNKELIEAYGSTNISVITHKFIYELYRAYSNQNKLRKDKDNNAIYEIGKNILLSKVADEHINNNTGKINKPKRVDYYLNKSIETAKRMGILLDYSIRENSNKDLIYCFTLNKNYQK